MTFSLTEEECSAETQLMVVRTTRWQTFPRTRKKQALLYKRHMDTKTVAWRDFFTRGYQVLWQTVRQKEKIFFLFLNLPPFLNIENHVWSMVICQSTWVTIQKNVTFSFIKNICVLYKIFLGAIVQSIMHVPKKHEIFIFMAADCKSIVVLQSCSTFPLPL